MLASGKNACLNHLRSNFHQFAGLSVRLYH